MNKILDVPSKVIQKGYGPGVSHKCTFAMEWHMWEMIVFG